MSKLKQIVSGGQTGVDRAALDAAIQAGVPHGGWCPRGRIAEDGRIPEIYELVEMESSHYADRTLQNVLDSTGTLILYVHKLQGGTALTARLAKQNAKPLLLVRLDRDWRLPMVLQWLIENEIEILNVAGPRASTSQSIYDQAHAFVMSLLSSASPASHRTR